jgi:hypothetical protein
MDVVLIGDDEVPDFIEQNPSGRSTSADDLSCIG